MTMLDNNLKFIERECSWVIDMINSSTANDKIRIEQNPGRPPTIFVADEGKKQYLHSKYNPYTEAERIINHIENIEGYDYIVFWGFGLGYHIEHFVGKYPNMPFSVVEPAIEAFKICLEFREISFLDRGCFDDIYFTVADPEAEKALEGFLNSMDASILIVPLASYEASFPDKYESFSQAFGQYFSNAEINDNTKKHNEKLHTLNVLKNFDYIINTPNILRLRHDSFKDKPAILVSAGPSLEYELDNLRHIKKNGLAYIFSAASAINTLLESNILPDACWSMDPDNSTLMVYEKLLAMDIHSVPLIFGTTAASDLVAKYPGDLYHFVTAKDLAIPFYMDNSLSPEEIVDSASSVAVVALLALHRLGFSPIILVGQNLAYKDNRYYSMGIDYGKGSKARPEEEFDHFYRVQSVDGSYVFTDDALNCFRKDMEHYIRNYGIGNIINTTKNGAVIKGTVYMTMEEVLKHHLKNKAVDPYWELKFDDYYDGKLLKKRAGIIKDKLTEFNALIEKFRDLSDKIYSTGDAYIPENLSSLFFKLFADILNNDFFHVFLYSMNVYECKMLIKHIRSMKNKDSSQLVPVSLYVKFADFVDTCIKDTNTVLPLILDMEMQIPDYFVFTITSSLS